METSDEAPGLTPDQEVRLERFLSGAPPREQRDMDVTRLELAPTALQVISAMEQRAAAVADEYGEVSPEHVDTLRSLVNALGHMLRLGGRITKDGELSLFGASFIAYGVIFHPHRKGGDPDPLRGTWSLHS